MDNREQKNLPVQENNGLGNYEEISEKKTSKLGYILLIIMAIFMIAIGQTVFSDLKRIPERPKAPSLCISSIAGKYANVKNLSYLSGSCTFMEIDKMFGLDVAYNNMHSDLSKIVNYNKQINTLNSNIRSTERNITNLNRDYDLSLQEKIANEDSIMNKDGIKSSIVTQRNSISSFKAKIESLENNIDSVYKSISPQLITLKKSYEQADEYYNDKMAMYRFKIFLLMLLFVLPFFIFSTYFYLKLKKKNSPYTIIFTAITTASTALFLQIVFMFLYEVLPMAWLVRLFSFFFEVPFLRYFIYYGSVILVIAIFGGIVYYIQKKVFSPQSVAIRRLKDNKCPGCSFVLNPDHNFCPKCGIQIKEKCETCNGLKSRYLKHCPNCGN